MKKLTNDELNRLSVDDYKRAEKNPVAIVLDNIRSLNNVGSVFRTSDAFRVEEILLCGITGTPPHREIRKTALGATESVTWKYFEDTQQAVRYLKEEGYIVISVEQVENSTSLENFQPDRTKNYAFVFGNEIHGVSLEVINETDFCIEIPQFGTKHSFNISSSAGIILWHYFFHSRK